MRKSFKELKKELNDMDMLLKSTLSEQASIHDRLSNLQKAQKEVDELAQFTLDNLENARKECGDSKEKIRISDVRQYLETLEKDRLTLQRLSAEAAASVYS